MQSSELSQSAVQEFTIRWHYRVLLNLVGACTYLKAGSQLNFNFSARRFCNLNIWRPFATGCKWPKSANRIRSWRLDWQAKKASLVLWHSVVRLDPSVGNDNIWEIQKTGVFSSNKQEAVRPPWCILLISYGSSIACSFHVFYDRIRPERTRKTGRYLNLLFCLCIHWRLDCSESTLVIKLAFGTKLHSTTTRRGAGHLPWCATGTSGCWHVNETKLPIGRLPNVTLSQSKVCQIFTLKLRVLP